MLICWIIILPPINAQSDANCNANLASRLLVDEQTRVVIEGGVNLRARPGTNERRITIVPADAIVAVLDGPFCAEGLAWWQIEFQNNRGWAAEGLSGTYFLEPYIVQEAQAGTAALKVVPEVANGIETQELDDRVEFLLQDYAIDNGFFPPVIRVFESLPDLEEIGRVQNALSNRDPALLAIPSLAKVAFISNQDGIGLRYLSVFVDANAPDADPALLYHYRSITDNGRFVGLNLPIAAPDLPLEFDPPQSAAADGDLLENYRMAYFEASVRAINDTANNDFTPTLITLDAVLRSITTSATPPPDENSVAFSYFDSLRLRYAPQLASSVSAESNEGSALIPRHIRVIFNAYPVANAANEPAIRVYSASFVPSDWLVRVQLLLSQQPNNPASIPLLIRQTETQAFRTQILYQRFQNGEGVRFVSAYPAADGGVTQADLFYAYQGLTDDRLFYISAIFPLQIPNTTLSSAATNEDLATAVGNLQPDELTPPLALLDALMQSVAMRTLDS